MLRLFQGRGEKKEKRKSEQQQLSTDPQSPWLKAIGDNFLPTLNLHG
jgi:hypothetical protein